MGPFDIENLKLKQIDKNENIVQSHALKKNKYTPAEITGFDENNVL